MKDNKYVVGKGRPPKHSRFKPGQSGNPSGRPKGSLDIKAILHKRLYEDIPLKGANEKRPAIDVLITQLRNKALQGDEKCITVLKQLIQAFGLPDMPDIDQSTSDWSDADKALLDDFLRRNGRGNKGGEDDRS